MIVTIAIHLRQPNLILTNSWGSDRESKVIEKAIFIIFDAQYVVILVGTLEE